MENDIKWPKGIKAAVSITFDVDAESQWINDESNKKRLSLLSSGAYGRRVGIPRILNLLKKHNIKSQFFIPGYTAEIDEQLVRKINDMGHDIGCHGYYHERTDTLTYDEEDNILSESIKIIKQLIWKTPIGYRAPLWELTPQTLELLVKHGFKYDSSLIGNDVPYVVSVNDDKILELPVTWILDDFIQFHYSVEPNIGEVIEGTTKVLDMWKEEFDALYKEGRYFMLTMHPYLTGRPSRIEMLDKLIKYIKEHDGVWFCTPEQIYNSWTKGELTTDGEYPY